MFLLTFSSAEYVIIITGREPRGRIAGQDVYRATDFDMLPLNPNISVQHPPHPVEGHLLALLRSHLYGGVFLFSYGWDLTRRLQLQWNHREHDANKASWEVVCLHCLCALLLVEIPLRQTIDSFGIGALWSVYTAQMS